MYITDHMWPILAAVVLQSKRAKIARQIREVYFYIVKILQVGIDTRIFAYLKKKKELQ